MPGGQPLRLGPFIGGINTASDPTAIADAELTVCDNMELDIDGSLISRPPFQELDGHASWTERIVMIGRGVFNGSYYLIGSNINGVFYYFNNTWTLITNTFQATVAIQYADSVYLVPAPGAAGPGGKWNLSSGFISIATMPEGEAAVTHKERLFIVPGIHTPDSDDPTRLKFSDAADFDTWDPVNFIDVGQGDGEKLIDVTSFQNNLLLFKNNSTYILAYDIRPTDAALIKISSTIGVSQQHCMVNYENQVYTFHSGWVYEIISNDFQRLNTKIPFIRNDAVPSAYAAETIHLSLLKDRLVCRFYRNVYVYGLRTRSWSQWESDESVLHFFGPIFTIMPTTGDEYYAGSSIGLFRTVVRLFDGHAAGIREAVLHPTITISDDFGATVSNGWGNLDTGETWSVVGAASSDFNKSGGKGVHRNTSVGVNRTSTLSGLYMNYDVMGEVNTPVVALTASYFLAVRARAVDASNFYTFRLECQVAGVLRLAINKTVAGVQSTLVTTDKTYAAGNTFKWRMRLITNSLKFKVWLSTDLEPNGWTLSTTDSTFPAAGFLYLLSVLGGGNTNTLPVNISWDNFHMADPEDVDRVISCAVKTKDFDMAVSHQFKKLWWWGADVSTDNNIVGTATPITRAFRVTWDQLALYTWDDLNTWDQPLTTAVSVVTSVPSGLGSSRSFVKFLKALRYRQINFQVQLTTDGSTDDGPARLFTMLAITESKQVVPKSVN